MARADRFLVEKGYAASRTEARAAILAGLVRIDGKLLAKPSHSVADGAAVEFRKPHPYVSRGGVKLAAALVHFGLSPQGRVALDLGASTGGFTQVLLVGGAAKVYAVDVGHGQLHADLRRDPRVVACEGVNARALSSAVISQPPGAIVADVSFIGLELILPPALALAALALAAPAAWLVALVKPQFEAGRAALSRGGIVRDRQVRERAVEKIAAFVGGQPGWSVIGRMESPVAGGDGNVEFLLAARKA